MLVAALVAASGVGAYDYVAASSSGDSSAASAYAPGKGPKNVDATLAAQATPFTTADVGDCLNWNIDSTGAVSNFEQTTCEKEHRFEISARENLATYPTSEFGPEAEMPDLMRQAQLREELCQAATLTYLDGKFDAAGKYTIAPILPPAESWRKGDRTMLCGLQANDEKGVPQQTTGKVADNDQSPLAKVGDCRAIDDSQILRTVDCSRKHHLETTAVIDLTKRFRKGTPSEDKQDAYLSKKCTDAAIDYLGSEDKLYDTTLQPFWGTVEESSWEAGSRSVNCSLIHANKKGGFSDITGSAKDGRTALTVDGKTPKKPPERNPKRKDRVSVAPSANPELPVAGSQGNVDTGGSNQTPAEPQQQVDTGAGQIDPNTGLPYGQATDQTGGQAVDQTGGGQIDPNTGLPYGQTGGQTGGQAGGGQIDPNTGLPY